MHAPVIPGLDDLEVVGRGGFAVVYRARQRSLRREVAVKVVVGAVDDERARERFERECESIARLGWHPNVVSVFDAGVADTGSPYLVMELLPLGSLGDRLAADGPMPWPEAAAHLVLVADALEAAHEAGLVHRDVKPENILVGPRGEPKLGDFGIARLADRTRTVGGQVTATLAHAAPELLEGEAGVPSDVYALGSTLFTLLQGSPAFLSADDQVLPALLNRIATAPVPDLRPSGVPDEVCQVVERAMAKAPDERWPSALAFGQALDAATADAPTTKPPPLSPRPDVVGPGEATIVVGGIDDDDESWFERERAVAGRPSPDAEGETVVLRAAGDPPDAPPPGIDPVDLRSGGAPRWVLPTVCVVLVSLLLVGARLLTGGSGEDAPDGPQLSFDTSVLAGAEVLVEGSGFSPRSTNAAAYCSVGDLVGCGRVAVFEADDDGAFAEPMEMGIALTSETVCGPSPVAVVVVPLAPDDRTAYVLPQALTGFGTTTSTTSTTSTSGTSGTSGTSTTEARSSSGLVQDLLDAARSGTTTSSSQAPEVTSPVSPDATIPDDVVLEEPVTCEEPRTPVTSSTTEVGSDDA